MLRSLVRGRARAVVPGLFAAALLIAGCGDGEAPQIDVAVAVDMAESVPLNEPLHLTYSWTPGAEFEAPMDDYQVFVHAMDPAGNVVFQDDHYPTEPTSQWAAGESLTYDRWVYIPDRLEIERIDFVVGLYSPTGRVQLRDGGSWTDAVSAHSLEVRLDDMSRMPAYIEGWHAQENDAGAGISWRWTEGLARVAFTNPRSAGVVHVDFHGPFDEIGAQELVVKAGETEVARFDIAHSDTYSERIAIPAEAMGEDDWVELTFETSPVLVPKELDPESADERSLGVQVFALYLSAS